MSHVHNGLHEYTRLLDAAARAVGEKSGAQDFSGIERFGETLTPIMDLWALPEWAILRGEILFARRQEAPAVAARFSSTELVNPTGSGVLAVVLTVLVDFSTVEGSVDSGVSIAANPVVRRGVALDTRFPQLGEVSRCTVTTGDVAANVALPQFRLATQAVVPMPFILRPGKKLFMINVTANTAMGNSLVWSERPLLPTEDRA